MKLNELAIIVTGGASGMGRTFALELAAAGARVMIADLDEAKIQAVIKEASELPGVVVGQRADVSREEDVGALIAAAWDAFGTLNGLINNAGIFRDGLLVRRTRGAEGIQKMSLDDWNKVIAVDLTGPFLCTRDFAASMLEHRVPASVVVNISSVARHGNRGQSNYSAAKAGLVADTKLWAEELARYGIRVGAVAPGLVRTPILDGMPPKALERISLQVPLGRVAEPEELWLAVKFVLECDYFTGRCIDVDGGLSV